MIATVAPSPGEISVAGEAGNGEDHDDGCKKDHVDCGKVAIVAAVVFSLTAKNKRLFLQWFGYWSCQLSYRQDKQNKALLIVVPYTAIIVWGDHVTC